MINIKARVLRRFLDGTQKEIEFDMTSLKELLNPGEIFELENRLNSSYPNLRWHLILTEENEQTSPCSSPSK